MGEVVGERGKRTEPGTRGEQVRSIGGNSHDPLDTLRGDRMPCQRQRCHVNSEQAEQP